VESWTVINRCGKNNSEQGPQIAVAVLSHLEGSKKLARQAVDTSFGKGRRFVAGARRKSRDYVTKHAIALVSALMICTPLDLVEMNN
jgi:hypothetical protein